ncbi:hypothetical protein J2S78_003190 [Salibacterium salarium]|nr:hypothetical protein [Salibacterium salarium]
MSEKASQAFKKKFLASVNMCSVTHFSVHADYMA